MQLIRWIPATVRAAVRRTATVNLIVTRRCDLNCSYCRAVRKAPELPVAVWLEIARRLSGRYAVFTVSGGEPLLYGDLPELIHGLSRIGLAALCTNARQLDASHLDALKGLDYLNFSFDQTGSSTASRKTAFGKLPLLVEYAARHRFALFGNAVITARTIDSIPDVIREASRFGIPLNLQLVQRPGPDDAFDTPEKLAQLTSLQEELLAMRRGGFLIDESEDYLRGMARFIQGEHAVHCHAGRTYLAVDVDGRLMPCQDTPAVGMPVHQIDDIEAALDNLPSAVPEGCRCWWNCFHWYHEWQENPLKFLVRETLPSLRARK